MGNSAVGPRLRRFRRGHSDRLRGPVISHPQRTNRRPGDSSTSQEVHWLETLPVMPRNHSSHALPFRTWRLLVQTPLLELVTILPHASYLPVKHPLHHAPGTA